MIYASLVLLFPTDRALRLPKSPSVVRSRTCAGSGTIGCAADHRQMTVCGHLTLDGHGMREKAQTLAGEGARVASSPADACRDAEAVMTMVSDDYALEQVVFGKDSMADAMQEDCVHISQSTISTALARRLSAEHMQRKQRFLSAPVFGRPE